MSNVTFPSLFSPWLPTPAVDERFNNGEAFKRSIANILKAE